MTHCGRNEKTFMKINRYITIVSLGALVFLGACEGDDESADRSMDSRERSDTSYDDTDTDNTANNHDDDSDDAKTSIDQSESSEHIAITSEIRRAIIDDDAMSMKAQNSTIITDESSVVTLRGTVDSQAERDSIEAKAEAVAGVTRVDNQLEVDTD